MAEKSEKRFLHLKADRKDEDRSSCIHSLTVKRKPFAKDRRWKRIREAFALSTVNFSD